jgi:hypothetical protein
LQREKKKGRSESHQKACKSPGKNCETTSTADQSISLSSIEDVRSGMKECKGKEERQTYAEDGKQEIEPELAAASVGEQGSELVQIKKR